MLNVDRWLMRQNYGAQHVFENILYALRGVVRQRSLAIYVNVPSAPYQDASVKLTEVVIALIHVKRSTERESWYWLGDKYLTTSWEDSWYRRRPHQ